MRLRLALPLSVLALLLGGCVMIVNRAGESLASQLGAAVLNSDDPATVRDGLPAYLLLLDGMIEGQKPGEKGGASLLFAAAELNGSYAGNFVGDDAARAQRMARKALDYARRGICLQQRAICDALDGDVETFEAAVAAANADATPALYAMAAAWAGYVQVNRDDWAAIADLPKIEALLLRVVELDPQHARGLPYVYLGVLNSLRPEAVGGKPEQGRAYFERAIALSDGRNLYAKTLMAEFYTRLVFDQDLHDRLLGEVLAADPKAPDYTLINVLAQQRASELLESGKDFF
ncbi:MAG TPA: TRAP transporter TatT component family protein [Arenimonas sp.]|nr:TRAP transporter TatT component family protein [Arenimonas sp.]